MSINKESKLKKLLDGYESGTVFLASWLEKQGFSRALQQRYRSSGWLESLGRGAFKRPNDYLSWETAFQSLTRQGDYPFHVGAITALALNGYVHHIRMGSTPVFLFSRSQKKLPKWFLEYEWHTSIKSIHTSLFKSDTGIIESGEIIRESYPRMSAPERSIMEALHLAPEKNDLGECAYAMESLFGLRPKIVTTLLQECNSIKVKRLFLFLAERYQHKWFQYLDLDKIDLGSGDRKIGVGGKYIPKYKISVPEELLV